MSTRTAAAATTSTSTAANANVTVAAARGTLWSIGLRILSFLCTQWTIRSLDDPSILGRATIQLELMLTTVLFLSREGFRLALTKNIQPESWPLVWYTMPFSLIISCLALFWHLFWTRGSNLEDDPQDADYRLAGICSCISCAIEGIVEPAVILSLRNMNVALKASAEGLASIAKTVTTVVVLKWLILSDHKTTWQITAFGIGQLMYSIVYATVLLRSTFSQLVRSRMGGSSSFHRPTAYMIVVFTLQGIFKHFLTEGDRIILTLLSGSYDQGVYAMASAYGSIAARILLQPLEENGRLLWSRLADNQPQRQTNTKTALEESYTVLVKLTLYIGLVFACLAPNYTSVLLKIMAGRTWGSNLEATEVLSAFCIYTAFMAVNGTTEAFVYAISNSAQDMGKLSAAHTFVGVVFAVVASFLVTRIGTTGLVLANCLGMFIRTGFSVYFAGQYFAERKKAALLAVLRDLATKILPKPITATAFIVSYFVTRYSKQRLTLETGIMTRDTMYHVVLGMICSMAVIMSIVLTERDFLHRLRGFARREKTD